MSVGRWRIQSATLTPKMRKSCRAMRSWHQNQNHPRLSGWWFQIFSISTPTWGNDPIWLINIFQRGWNHQPVIFFEKTFLLLSLKSPWCHGQTVGSSVYFLPERPFVGFSEDRFFFCFRKGLVLPMKGHVYKQMVFKIQSDRAKVASDRPNNWADHAEIINY